jgi:hypothetical protein
MVFYGSMLVISKEDSTKKIHDDQVNEKYRINLHVLVPFLITIISIMVQTFKPQTLQPFQTNKR